MKITIVLPGAGVTPSGGYRVAYEYANRLCERGHCVTVVHPAYVAGVRRESTFSAWRRTWGRYLSRLLGSRWRPDNWMPINPGVDMRWVPSLDPRYVPDGDAIVATLWVTAEPVAALSPSKGRKVYLIQGLETWGGHEARVMATWRAPLTKVVIASWLRDVAEALGEQAVCIPNGLDFSRFGCDVPISTRSPCVIGMLNHELPLKGAVDALAALRIVQGVVPGLRVEMFGIPPAQPDLPSWVTYHRNPSQESLRRLYNRCAIFLAPSHGEGWGLTASEAMTCGAALVATDTGGHREFAVDGETALLCPPKDIAAMAAAVLRLVNDNDLRIRLATRGSEDIRRFSWDVAVARMERVLAGDAGAGACKGKEPGAR